MIRTTFALIAALLLATSAATAPRPTAHKPAKPAARPAPHAPATASPAQDARDPATMVALLQGGGAKAQIARKDGDAVLVTATSAFANFSVQYLECDPTGRACKAAVLDTQAEGSPSLAQINGFNQSSALCRGYLDKTGKSHVVMSMPLFGDESHDELVTQMIAWQNCIAQFSNFARDPVAYLANAP